MASKEKVRLFVIYCEEDDSHTTLEETNVICEPSVQVGDEVHFFCGRKSPWLGVIKAIGDDLVEMNQIRDDLNARKPNREGSFHADRKRKTAVKARDTLSKQLRTTSRSKKASGEPESSLHSNSRQMTTAERQYVSKLQGSLINYSGSDSDQDGRAAPSREDVRQLSDSEQEEAVQPKKRVGSAALAKLLSSNSNTSDSGSEKSDREAAEPTDRNDSSSSEEELTPEELAVLQKAARKRKLNDINELIALSKEGNQTPGVSKKGQKGSSQAVSNSSGVKAKTPSKTSEHNSLKHQRTTGPVSMPQPSDSTDSNRPQKPSETRADSGTGSSSTPKSSSLVSKPQPNDSTGGNRPQQPRGTSETGADSGTGSRSSLKPSVKRSRYCPSYKKKVFDGEYFLHKSGDPGVEKLWPSHEVYILSEDLSFVRKKASSGKEVGRLLVSRIFTQQAIDECSVTGRPASGRGKEQATLRPPLDPKGVEAIIEYAKSRAKKKKWTEVSATEVKKSITNILVENRYTKRLAEEVSENVADDES